MHKDKAKDKQSSRVTYETFEALKERKIPGFPIGLSSHVLSEELSGMTCGLCGNDLSKPCSQRRGGEMRRNNFFLTGCSGLTG